jgi:hypothetical protein
MPKTFLEIPLLASTIPAGTNSLNALRLWAVVTKPIKSNGIIGARLSDLWNCMISFFVFDDFAFSSI